MNNEQRVIQIAPDGNLKLTMPDLAGRFLIIEERDGQIIMSPFDLRYHDLDCSVAKIGSKLHLVPSAHTNSPEA